MSYLCPDSQSLVFLGADLFFQKVSESSACFRVVVWGSVFCLTPWQGGSAKIWTECPAVPNPFPFPPAAPVLLPLRHEFTWWCFDGVSCAMVPQPPGFVSAIFPWPSVDGRGEGAIYNAGWIPASLGAEEITPSWNWARDTAPLRQQGCNSSRGQLCRIEFLPVGLISSPAH